MKLSQFKLLIFTFFNDFGSNIFTFAINLYILKITGSALAFSTGMIIIPIVNMFFFSSSANIINKYGAKKTILLSFLGAIISLLCNLSIISIVDTKYYTISILLFQIFILRVCDILIQVSLMILLPQIIESNDLQRVNSSIQTTSRLSGIISPFIAGSLFAIIPIQIIGTIELILDVICLTTILSIKESAKSEIDVPKTSSMEKNNKKTSIYKNIQYILGHNMVLGFLILCILMNIGLGAFQVGIPYLMMEKMNYTSAEYGLIESFFAFGSLLSGILLSILNKDFSLRASYSTFLLFSLSFLGIGIGLYLTGHFTVLIILLGSIFIMGIGTTLSSVTMITLFQKNVPQEKQAHVFSFFDTVVTASIPIFIALFGILFQKNSNPLIFIIISIIVTLSVLLCNLKLSYKK